MLWNDCPRPVPGSALPCEARSTAMHGGAGADVRRLGLDEVVRRFAEREAPRSGQVDIRGAIVAIGDMGTQKEIAGQIIDGGADDVSILKGNHETLSRADVASIDEHREGDLPRAQERVTTATGHKRDEVQTYLQLPDPADLPGIGQSTELEVKPDDHLALPSRRRGDDRDPR